MKDTELSTVTRLLHHRVEIDGARPSVTPLFQNSAFEAGSPHFYTRKSNPNSVELEESMAILEEAKFCTAVSTGMAAIQCVLNLLRPGETLVVDEYLYGCSFRHFERFSERLGLKFVVADLADPAALAALPEESRMIFFETPTNPFLKTISIRTVRERFSSAKRPPLIVVDNTWATPLYQKPLQHGADVSLHSATKYVSGHSDVMGGLVLTSDPALDQFFKDERFYGGCVMDPHSAWLLRRSLQTLDLRVRAQTETTLEMKNFLEGLKWVGKVYFPKVDGKQLVAYGGIVFFELADAYRDRYTEFRDALEIFGTGTGMACVTSMVAQPYTGSHASMDDAAKSRMGLDKSLVRLCFGLESIDDLKSDLMTAFARLG